MLVVIEDKCTGCGQCQMTCPLDAVEVWGLAVIKKESCNECLLCIDWCPVDALEWRDR